VFLGKPISDDFRIVARGAATFFLPTWTFVPVHMKGIRLLEGFGQNAQIAHEE
jgi:hypothetical protein